MNLRLRELRERERELLLVTGKKGGFFIEGNVVWLEVYFPLLHLIPLKLEK
ncbi:hypothetical protein KFK09_010325 [Dendrobium nobile]|uniref:Uncharacterized protein n=1 Tax=Dendrobium nobile TaxID=94219 RepID=A0A8T3BKB5_DENNO|nr:hypothetical protein KFK09_010325 [Dendrobium nobile]